MICVVFLRLHPGLFYKVDAAFSLEKFQRFFVFDEGNGSLLFLVIVLEKSDFFRFLLFELWIIRVFFLLVLKGLLLDSLIVLYFLDFSIKVLVLLFNVGVFSRDVGVFWDYVVDFIVEREVVCSHLLMQIFMVFFYFSHFYVSGWLLDERMYILC